jgi:hypothetical protein
VALGQVLSEYFGFPCQSSFHQLLHRHLSPGAGTIGKQWPTYQVDSVSPHPEKVKKEKTIKMPISKSRAELSLLYLRHSGGDCEDYCLLRCDAVYLADRMTDRTASKAEQASTANNFQIFLPHFLIFRRFFTSSLKLSMFI